MKIVKFPVENRPSDLTRNAPSLQFDSGLARTLQIQPDLEKGDACKELGGFEDSKPQATSISRESVSTRTAENHNALYEKAQSGAERIFHDNCKSTHNILSIMTMVERESSFVGETRTMFEYT